MAKETDLLDVLLHYHVTGGMAQGAILSPSPASLGASVPDDEVWEVMTHPEVSFSDNIQGAGTVADLLVVPVVDTTNLQDYLYYLFSQDANFNPPPMYVDGPKQPLLAEGLLAALAAQARGEPFYRVMEMASSLKVAQGLTVQVTALTAITLDFDIKIKGKKWKQDEFARLFGGAGLAGTYAIQRKTEGNAISFPVARIPISFSGWANLPGGKSQTTGLKFMPRMNYAINANATTRGKAYPMSFQAGTTANVQNQQQEQYWPYSILTAAGDKIMAVKGFAARSRYAAALGGTHLQNAAIALENDVEFEDHPADLFLVTDRDNDRLVGWQAPVGRPGWYRSVPRMGLYIFNDTAHVDVYDDGTATVAEGDILTVVDGFSVENYGQIPGLTLIRRGQVVQQNPGGAAA